MFKEIVNKNQKVAVVLHTDSSNTLSTILYEVQLLPFEANQTPRILKQNREIKNDILHGFPIL